MQQIKIDVNGDRAATASAVSMLQEKVGDEWDVVACDVKITEKELAISSMALSMHLLNLDQLKTVHSMVAEMVVESKV